MRALSIGLTVLSALLIAAHFFRSGSYLLTAVGALFPALLLLRRRFAVRVVQALLFVAALEWIRTLILLAMDRQAMGQPWIRMALILGTVAGVSVVAALLIGRRFGRADAVDSGVRS